MAPAKGIPMAYYVYELRDPRDGSTFYVGKGKGGRINCHEREARAGRQSRKCERIRQIEAAGLSVVKAKVARFDDEQEAYDSEARLIEQYGLASLTNVLSGGGVGRNLPTLAADRMRVRLASEMLSRLGGGRVASITIWGQTLDLKKITDDFKAGAAKVVARRGVDWVNAIAARYSVEFVANG